MLKSGVSRGPSPAQKVNPRAQPAVVSAAGTIYAPRRSADASASLASYDITIPGPSIAPPQPARKITYKRKHTPTLTWLLSKAASWHDLRRMFGEHRHELSLAHFDVIVQKLSDGVHARSLGVRERGELRAFLDDVSSFAGAKLGAFSARQASQLMWTLSQLEYAPSGEFLSAVLHFTQRNLESFGAADLSRMLHGLTVSRAELQEAWVQDVLAVFERQLSSKTARARIGPEDLDCFITAVVRSGYRPQPSWTDEFTRHVVAGIQQCQPSTLISIMSAVASLGHSPPAFVAQHYAKHVAAEAQWLRPQQLTTIMQTLAAFRYHPRPPRMTQLMKCVLLNSTHFAAADVVSIIHAAAVVGEELQPAWVDVLLLQVQQHLQQLDAHQLVTLLSAFGAHHYRPRPSFMKSFMERLQPGLSQLDLPELAGLIASLADFHVRPSPQWMSRYIGSLLHWAPFAESHPLLLRVLRSMGAMQYVPPADFLNNVETQVRQLAAEAERHSATAAIATGGSTSSATGRSSAAHGGVSLPEFERAFEDLRYKAPVPAPADESTDEDVEVDEAGANEYTADEGQRFVGDLEGNEAGVLGTERGDFTSSMGSSADDMVSEASQHQQHRPLELAGAVDSSRAAVAEAAAAILAASKWGGSSSSSTVAQQSAE